MLLSLNLSKIMSLLLLKRSKQDIDTLRQEGFGQVFVFGPTMYLSFLYKQNWVSLDAEKYNVKHLYIHFI